MRGDWEFACRLNPIICGDFSISVFIPAQEMEYLSKRQRHNFDRNQIIAFDEEKEFRRDLGSYLNI